MDYDKEINELKKEVAKVRKDLRELEKKYYNHRTNETIHLV